MRTGKRKHGDSSPLRFGLLFAITLAWNAVSLAESDYLSSRTPARTKV